jgi:hypothetical protein
MAGGAIEDVPERDRIAGLTAMLKASARRITREPAWGMARYPSI